MYQPSAVPPKAPSSSPTAPAAEPGAPGLSLVREVREAQHRALWAQGVLLGVAALISFVITGGFIALNHPVAAQWLIACGPMVALGLGLFFGVYLPRKRVGDTERTARLLATKLPELSLDLLAAVELSKALGRPDDFSPELARAFLRSVDVRAARHSAASLIDQRPVRRTAVALLLVLVGGAVTLGLAGARVRAGLVRAFLATGDADTSHREPITGDFELTYHYPAHTGLEARTVAASTGDISAPAGTEVEVKTRADRDVSAAALIVNGARVGMLVKGRNLSAKFLLETSGQYHVAFLSGERVKAEGPDLSITVEADQPPQVRITSPGSELELDPAKQQVTVKFEANDDYGIAALDLVFRPSGGEQQRVTLKPDDGRTTRGQYQWELLPLKLKPGQTVSYFLEATDNDAVKGPKKGVSATLKLKLYSADEHRREALKKAEALWERLILHLADRLEGADRISPATREAALAGAPVDERASHLYQDFNQLTADLRHDRDPPEELVDALANISTQLTRDTAAISAQRRVLTREVRPGVPAEAPPSLARRLSISVAADADHSEKNVLYLEALLDRQKLEAIKALARELKEDRRELSALLEDYNKTKDPATQQALLDQMAQLKQQMLELEQRMSELAKGLRDDFMNADAMQEMMNEQNLGSTLDEVEKLIREGKSEEAMKKMQELSMQMDEFLQNLDEAADSADQKMDPELAKKFEEFQDNLEQTVQQQDALSEKTRAMRDKYRAQQKERIARQGEALKKELQQKLDELDKSWKQLDGDRYGSRFQDTKSQAERDLENVKQSLAADDFDLASESADRLEQKSDQMASEADEQRRLDEMFQNPPEVRRESKQLRDKLSHDAKKAEEIAKKLRDLFPQPGQQMSDPDRAQMQDMAKSQKQLQQRAQQLQQQMEDIGQRAPIFNEEAQQQVEQAAEKMQNAGQRLQGKDASRGYGEQQGALQSLKGLQQSMQQQAGKGGKGGIPLPLKGAGQGRGTKQEKVEIPDEDPNLAPREFRKDVMELMKQGAPDRYRDQNKKYYEELVK